MDRAEGQDTLGNDGNGNGERSFLDDGADEPFPSSPAPAPTPTPPAPVATAPASAPAVEEAAAVGTVAAAAAAASTAVSDLSQKVMESPGLMVAAIFVLLLIIFVCIYIYVKLKSNLKYYEVLSKPMYLNNLKSMTLTSDSSFPKANGAQYTYAFWVYGNSVKPTSNYKLLMRREDNPIVYMDPTQAKMYIRLKTTLADTQGASIDHLDTMTTSASVSWKDTHGTMAPPPAVPPAAAGAPAFPSMTTPFASDVCHYSQIVIPYVPMQRWVHYAIVVDGEYIIVYQDGEINSVLNLASDKSCLMNGAANMETFDGAVAMPVMDATKGGVRSTDTSVQNVGGVTKTHGDLMIGSATPADSPDTVISRVVFFNYAISMGDVAALYQKGPMPQSVLSALGIPMYGVRSPFYRIDSVSVTDPNATSSTAAPTS